MHAVGAGLWPCACNRLIGQGCCDSITWPPPEAALLIRIRAHNAQEAIDKGWFHAERTLVGGSGAPNLATILATAAEVAEGMRFLHERNVLHGDLTGGARLQLLAWLSLCSVASLRS